MENIDIDIDIDKDILENIDIDIDIDKDILENIDIDINIDKDILENIDIDKISNQLEFVISNRATLALSCIDTVELILSGPVTHPGQSTCIIQSNVMKHFHTSSFALTAITFDTYGS